MVFLYLIMLNLLKEHYVLPAIQLWIHICVVTVCYCEMFWAHLPHRLSSLTNDRHVWFFGLVLCVDWDASYSSQVFNSLFQSQLWSIVTSGGSAFHNISWRHTATTPGTGLLLARSVAGPKVGDYSWHGTTPGPWHRHALRWFAALAGASGLASVCASVAAKIINPRAYINLGKSWTIFKILVKIMYNNLKLTAKMNLLLTF